MSTAKLNVWITAIADACHIVDKDEWYVHITDCTGKPLVWCKKTYTFLKAECGHLEIDIPPGCYTVFAGHTAREADGVQPFGNRLTHVQVVRANCGDHVCVTLFSPGLWYCGTWFEQAVTQQFAALERAKIDPKLARAAVTAVKAFVAKLEPEPYGLNVLKAVERDPRK